MIVKTSTVVEEKVLLTLNAKVCMNKIRFIGASILMTSLLIVLPGCSKDVGILSPSQASEDTTMEDAISDSFASLEGEYKRIFSYMEDKGIETYPAFLSSFENKQEREKVSALRAVSLEGLSKDALEVISAIELYDKQHGSFAEYGVAYNSILQTSRLPKNSAEYRLIEESIAVALYHLGTVYRTPKNDRLRAKWWYDSWEDAVQCITKCVGGTVGSTILGALAGAGVGTVTLPVVGTVSGSAVGAVGGAMTGAATFC